MRISIWRITSAPDDHTLLAHHITSFNTYTTGVCVDMDLRGDYFATNGRSPNHIDIYDWRRSSSLVHHKATIALGPKNAVVSNLLKLAAALSLLPAEIYSYSLRTTNSYI